MSIVVPIRPYAHDLLAHEPLLSQLPLEPQLAAQLVAIATPAAAATTAWRQRRRCGLVERRAADRALALEHGPVRQAVRVVVVAAARHAMIDRTGAIIQAYRTLDIDRVVIGRTDRNDPDGLRASPTQSKQK